MHAMQGHRGDVRLGLVSAGTRQWPALLVLLRHCCPRRLHMLLTLVAPAVSCTPMKVDNSPPASPSRPLEAMAGLIASRGKCGKCCPISTPV